jgi:predicted ATP-grasp superfamily ATP-dependent carboligase
MAEPAQHPRPWLIAAWPGMGSVAIVAAGYLIRELNMEQAGSLPSRDHFDVNEVSVKDGVLEPVRLPRGVFFRWTNPGPGRDLVIFLGEAQPASGTFAYAHELLEAAGEMNIERVVTFASMASGLQPGENPKVSGIATDREMVAELRRAEVTPLEEGVVGGLNGVLLAAAAERAIPGMCLLAEIPFFAANVPNPKAARVALSVFAILSGIDINLEELGKHAAAVDRALIEAYNKLAEGRSAGEPHEDPGEPTESTETASEAPPQEPKLDLAARKHIERLFDEARKDPAKAMILKKELDRRGVFKLYENRFLDLFRRGD